MKNDKRPDRFLVGSVSGDNPAYGRMMRWADPFTLAEAREVIKKLDWQSDKAIYELVPLPAPAKARTAAKRKEPSKKRTHV